MKAILSSFLVLIVFFPSLHAQVEIKDGLYFNKSGRQVWITDMQGRDYPRSLLCRVSKDSIFFIETNQKTLKSTDQIQEVLGIHYSQIQTLTTIKNSPGKNGAIIGGTLGIPLGIAFNAAADKSVESTPGVGTLFADAYDQPSMVFGSILLGSGIGAGTGALIGKGAKKSWKIEGSKINFDKFLLDLDRRAYWNRSSR